VLCCFGVDQAAGKGSVVGHSVCLVTEPWVASLLVHNDLDIECINVSWVFNETSQKNRLLTKRQGRVYV